MSTSPQNRLPCIIRRIEPGAANMEVLIELEGGAQIVAAIDKKEVSRLGLAVGEPAWAVIKAANVGVGV